MSAEMTEGQKRKIAELDEKAKIELARKDPSYRAQHPELVLDAKTDLNDPEQRKVVEKLIERKNEREEEKSKEELQEELEDMKNKMAIVAQQAFEKKKTSLNCTDAEITTPEQLRMWEKGRKTVEIRNTAPSGSAPMNEFQMGGVSRNNENLPFRQKKFDSYESMITYLHAQIANGSAEAKVALDELLAKGLKDYGKVHGDISYSPDKNVQKSSAVPEVIMDNLEEQDSELSKFGVKKKSKEKWGSVPKKESE